MQPHLQIHHPYPPALERTIRLALERGEVMDKAQARIEHVSPKSISDRWERIADSVGLKWGQRQRSHVIVALFRLRHVEFLLVIILAVPVVISGLVRLRIIEYIMLALVLWVGTLPPNSVDVIRPRTPSRTVRSRRLREDYLDYPLAAIQQKAAA